MSQPPPWDQGQTPDQDQRPDQDQTPNQGRLPSWPSGDQPPAWPSTIKALTGSPQNEDAHNDAVLVGGNEQNYSADFAGIAGYTNFDSGTIHVAQGDTVTGAVTFQVPDGVAVSKVQWSALNGFGSMVEWDVHG